MSILVADYTFQWERKRMDKIFYFEGDDEDVDRLNEWFKANGAHKSVRAEWKEQKHPFPQIAGIIDPEEPLEWTELWVYSGEGYGFSLNMVEYFPCVVALNDYGYPTVHTSDHALSQFEVAI